MAGPAALLVSKVIKISDRATEMESGAKSRLKDKDALDVLRILRAVDMDSLRTRLVMLASIDLSAATTRAAIEDLPILFGTTSGRGSIMAANAAFPGEAREVIAASCAALTSELFAGMSAPPAP